MDTFNLEMYVKRSLNYLNHMVDSAQVPYFNIFWTEPAEAAHDWPDLTDVMARQLQGAIMLFEMTGIESENEADWSKKLLALIDRDTGLVYRNKTNYNESKVEMGGHALIMYTLVSLYHKNGDPQIPVLVDKMAQSLSKIFRSDYADEEIQFSYGFIIKSLMAAYRYCDSPAALDFAGKLVHIIMDESILFPPDNTFGERGHMHGNLRTLMGVADYALCVNDAVLFSRVDAIFRYVSSLRTSFGFLPEVAGRKGDVVSCETCALMDYIGLAATLANAGHADYWELIETTVRNHLVESQVKDVSWLHSDNSLEDTDQFSWRDIGERMSGGYAGWSSPTHILAAKETLNKLWGGSELKNKCRAFQNCCGGSGTHAFYIAWKNAAQFIDHTLFVNLLFDKLIEQAEIRSFEPYEGRIEIRLKTACCARIRVPGNAARLSYNVTVNSIKQTVNIFGNYLLLNSLSSGDYIVITYALSHIEEIISIGNTDGRKYHYHVKWQGSTVTEISPAEEFPDEAFSDFEDEVVPVFYSEKGPGRLYLDRTGFQGVEPILAQINFDNGEGNFWNLTKTTAKEER